MQGDPVRVTLAATGEPSGLAMMLAQYFEQNLRDCPQKRHQAERIRGTLGIVAREGDVGVTVQFMGGEIRITDGSAPDAHLSVYGGIFSLTELATGGVGAMRKLAQGELTVRAAWKHPLFAWRVAQFMRVPAEVWAGTWKVAAGTGAALAVLGLVVYVLST